VTTGTNITDSASNAANTAPAAVTVTGTPAGGSDLPRPSGSPSIY